MMSPKVRPSLYRVPQGSGIAVYESLSLGAAWKYLGEGEMFVEAGEDDWADETPGKAIRILSPRLGRCWMTLHTRDFVEIV